MGNLKKNVETNMGVTEYYFNESKEKIHKGNILFVHGANHGAWCWNENFSKYFSEKGYSVYSINLFNHGKSSKRKFLTLNKYKQQLVEIIDALKIKPIIIGHSAGGAVVQMYIKEHPQKYESCILLSSVPPWGINGDFKCAMKKYFLNEIKLMLFDLKLNKNYPINLFFKTNEGNKYKKYCIPEPFLACMGCFKPTFKGDWNHKDLSMLVIGSSEDKIISSNTIKLLSKYYNSESVIFNNIGHDMMLDKGWEAVAESIYLYLENTN